MSKVNDQMVEAITVLIRLTQSGEIKWESSKDATLEKRDDIVFGTVYTTKYIDKKMRIYKLTTKISDRLGLSSIFSIQSSEPHYWQTNVRLEFLDINNNPTWTFPQNGALQDLWEAASYQSAGVDEFINKLINKNKK